MSRFIILLLLLAACSPNSSVPDTVLPPVKMQAVLYDMIQADEMADFQSIVDSSYRKFSKRTTLYDTIFSLHAINKTLFQKSLVYYQGRPDLLKTIFDSLQVKANDTLQRKKPGASDKKRDTSRTPKPPIS